MPVVGLYIASHAGRPMTSLASASLVNEPGGPSGGGGIEGDRYRDATGHWSDPRWPDQQITLVEAETADDLGLDPSLLRRNVVTRGDRLTDLIGSDVRIGDTVLRFVRPCDPCGYLESLLEKPGLRAALEGRGGVRAAVITSGTITVGDSLRTCR